jgi:hypothetical protein
LAYIAELLSRKMALIAAVEADEVSDASRTPGRIASIDAGHAYASTVAFEAVPVR